MAIKPAAIAGTSIGALIGAAYAAGMRGKDIRRHVIALAHNRGETTRRLLAARAGTLADLFAGAFGQATQINAEKFCAQFLPDAIPPDFAALAIPLTVMATDLYRRQEAGVRGRSADAGARRLDRDSRAVPAGDASTGAFWSTAAPAIPCPSIICAGSPKSLSPSTCSACRRRNAPTCRARGNACTRRCWSWAAPSSPRSSTTPGPIS